MSVAKEIARKPFNQHIPHLYPDEGEVNPALPTADTSIFNNPLTDAVIKNRSLLGRIVIPDYDQGQSEVQKESFDLIAGWMLNQNKPSHERKKSVRKIDHFCESGEAFRMTEDILSFQIRQFSDDDEKAEIVSQYEELLEKLREKFGKTNERQPAQYFKGTLRFGAHSVEKASDILDIAQLLADDIRGTFRQGERNIALLEAADMPSSAPKDHKFFYRQYGSHTMAYMATLLKREKKVISLKTIRQITDIIMQSDNDTHNFVLGYLLALDLLQNQGYQIEARYEDNKIPPDEMKKRVNDFKQGYRYINSRDEFKEFFVNYARDIISSRDIEFARLINEIAQEPESQEKPTNIFGFIGLAHMRGILNRLDERLKPLVTGAEVQHIFSSASYGLEDIINLRLASGKEISDQEWDQYYQVWRHQHIRDSLTNNKE